MINILTGGSGSGSGLRLLAYLPFVKMANNKQQGLSKQSDGSTDAHGTLYPTDLNTSSNLGSLNSYVAQILNYSMGTADNEIVANNAEKVLVGENYFSKYKRFKYAKIRVANKWKQALTNISGDSNTYPQKVVELDNDRIMIFFKAAGSGHWCQVVKRDANNVITNGSPFQLDSNNNSTDPFKLDAVKIATDKVFTINSNTSNARVLSVSDTTITAGTAVAFTAGSSDIALDSYATDSVVIAYNESSAVWVRTATVSGTTITMNSAATTSANGSNVMILVESSTKALLTYSVSTQQKGRVITISGGSVTVEANVDIGAAGEHNSYKGMFKRVATNKYLLLTSTGKAHVLTISGTSFSVVTNTPTNTIQGTYWSSLIEITAGTTYHFYQIYDGNRYVRTLSISGTTVTESNYTSTAISEDSESGGQVRNIYIATVWPWGSDLFLYSRGVSFGSFNGMYGYIGPKGTSTWQLRNNGVAIGSDKTTDYAFVEVQSAIDSAILTGKKCYFGIRNTSGANRYLGLFELLVEVE